MAQAHNRINYQVGDVLSGCVYLSEEPIRIIKGKHHRYAKFRCICGNEFIHSIHLVLHGKTKCGCTIKNRAHVKHGCSFAGKVTNEYRIWAGIKRRCYKQTDKAYPTYGGRGIVMSDEWKNSFPAFLRDMGLRPSKIHSVDRIDGTKGYCVEKSVTQPVRRFTGRKY